MTDAVHLYTSRHQPATLYQIELAGQVRQQRNPPGRLLFAHCCQKMRPARNLTVQVYYDAVPFWCRPGKGCKAPSARKRVADKRLVAEFERGLSFVGLGRKYGMTSLEVQARVRMYLRRQEGR